MDRERLQKIVVTGSGGFLGRHVVPVLQHRYGAENVVPVSRDQYNLEVAGQFGQMLLDHQPDVVVHLAAFVGGIGVNKERPADFYFRNTLLAAYAFQAAAEYKLKKLVYTMGGCSYPAAASSPIDEGQMWNGYPQMESAGYSMAKKMGLVASQSYRSQYGLNSIVLVPGNLYGEYDNFRRNESHVVPALLRRCYEAQRAGDAELVVWGTGKATRDFVYAADVAAMFPFFIEEYSSSEPVNLSSGTSVSIRELCECVTATTGFRGKLVWDTSKPDGQMVKIFDTSRMKSLGLSCPTPLGEGLQRTFAWLAANYDTSGDALRL